jgi:hypothetical protein
VGRCIAGLNRDTPHTHSCCHAAALLRCTRSTKQVHYFVFKTHMTGLLQTAFYFGYTAMFCAGLSLMCGAVGYWGAAGFVRTIYRNVKCD